MMILRVETVQKQYLPVFRGISVFPWKYKVNSLWKWNTTKYRYHFILYRFNPKLQQQEYRILNEIIGTKI